MEHDDGNVFLWNGEQIVAGRYRDGEGERYDSFGTWLAAWANKQEDEASAGDAASASLLTDRPGRHSRRAAVPRCEQAVDQLV